MNLHPRGGDAMKGDIVRLKREMTIDRSKALLFVEMLNERFGKSHKFCLTHDGICLKTTVISIVSYKIVLPIIFQPLSNNGNFVPDTVLFSSIFSSKSEQMVRIILRTIFQPPTNWICTKLPDPAKLAKYIDIISSDHSEAWSVQIGKDDSLSLSWAENSGLCPKPTLILDSYECEWSSAILSEWINDIRVLAEASQKSETITCHLIADSIERLIQFLPHLIILAGGKVKFLD
jgi:hypothetical protein